MNTSIRKTFSRLALAGALAATAIPAQAQDLEFTALMAAQVGRIIASQGNAALITIREEMEATISRSLQPFLPEAPEAVKTGGESTAGADVVADELAARPSI